MFGQIPSNVVIDRGKTGGRSAFSRPLLAAMARRLVPGVVLWAQAGEYGSVKQNAIAALVLGCLGMGCGSTGSRAELSPFPDQSPTGMMAEESSAPMASAAPMPPGAPMSQSRAGMARPSRTIAMDDGPIAQGAEGVQSSGDAPDGNAAVAPPNKQLIYQATLNLAVFQVSKALDEVDHLVRELGGYLVNRSDQAITIRVPSERFREALQKVKTFGDVLSQNISVQDVTDQFFDLQARIRNARAVRDRLAELLKKTTNIEEALSVERELRRIGDELEQMEGQLKRLSELIAFSTLTVHFQPPPQDPVDQVVRLPFPWLDDLGLSNLLRL
jgi:Domain of unknown function (DUF4349)